MTEHQYYDNLYGQIRFGRARMDLPETLSNKGDLILGTRHLIRIIDSTGTVRVAQYGQWDGYPDGQGVDLLKYMHQLGFDDAESRSNFDALLQNLTFVDEQVDKEIDELLPKLGQSLSDTFPGMSRDTSADIMLIIAGQWSGSMHEKARDDKGRIRLMNMDKFGSDTVMCEWVYEIDFSNDQFRVRRDDKTPVLATFGLGNLPDRASFLKMTEAAANAAYEE